MLWHVINEILSRTLCCPGVAYDNLASVLPLSISYRSEVGAEAEAPDISPSVRGILTSRIAGTQRFYLEGLALVICKRGMVLKVALLCSTTLSV